MNFSETFRFRLAGEVADSAGRLAVLGVLLAVALLAWSAGVIAGRAGGIASRPSRRRRGPRASLLALGLLATPAQAGVRSLDDLAAITRQKGVPILSVAEAIDAPTDQSDPAIVARAFQACYDALARSDVASGSKQVYVPVGVWKTDRPVFADVPNVELTGPGQIAPGNQRCHPLVLAGFRRVPYNGAALTADHYPDATGRLDPAVGARLGLRLKDDCTLAEWSGPLTFGPQGGWPAIADGLTISLAFDTDAADISSLNGPGMSRKGVATPWVIHAWGGSLNLNFRLRGEATDRVLKAALPARGGVQRYDLQVDLAAGVGQVFYNRTALAVSGTGVSFPAGSRLDENEGMQFRLGATGDRVTAYTNDFFQSGASHDLLLLGMHVSQVARYNNVATGAAMVRRDARAIDDKLVYFTADASTVGLFPLQDVVADAAACRMVDYTTGLDGVGWKSKAFFVDAKHDNNFNSIGGLAFSGFTMTGNGYYGHGLSFGPALNVLVEGVNVQVGTQALGWINATANYTHRIERSTLAGNDCALACYFAMADVNDCYFVKAGRNGVLRGNQSNLRVRNGFIAMPSTGVNATRRLVVTYDCQVLVSGLRDDIEFNNSPTESLFDCTALASGSSAYGYLALERFAGNLPSTLGNVPLARLRMIGSGKPAACRIVDPVLTGTGPLIDTDGGWGVVVDHAITPSNVGINDSSGGTGQPIRLRYLQPSDVGTTGP